MKKQKLVLVIFFLVALNFFFGSIKVKAQTSVPAGNVSGTWTLAGSPYNIQGSIQITDGTTLTIQPGVIVNFQGTYKLNVQGRLLAIGTATDTIIFTATNTTNGWRGIRFDQTPLSNDTSKIYFCKLQYGIKTSGNNDAEGDGGALFFYNVSKIIISNCYISNCKVNVFGGGIYCMNGDLTFEKNSISNNTASSGGGIYFRNSNQILSNSIISNNTASSYGGGVYFDGGSQVLTNNSITHNSSINGGGLYFFTNSNPTLLNCILWGNTASASGPTVFILDESSDPNFSYCDVEGGAASFELNGNIYTGTYQNNINSDPLFVSPSGGSGTGFNGVTANWALQSTSPCINAGDLGGTYPGIDRVGNTRVTVCRIDMGAYEYQNGTPFTATVSQNLQNLCYGDTTATATVIVTGGAPTYTYLWSNGQTISTASGLGQGTYTVTATEASYGCSITKTITISQPPQLAFTITKGNVLCNGGNSGSITVNVSGGTGVIQYSKNNGSTYQLSNVFTGLTATNYQMVVKDANTCITSSQNIIITEPSLLSFTKTSSNVQCFNGNSGSIAVNAIGGAGILQYSKDNGSTYQSSNVLSGLVANTYPIVVKDANNCITSSQSVIITEPTLLSFTNTSSNVLCKNGNTGTITVNASGGTGTFQYSKDNGNNYQSSAIFNGLVANTYQIVVKDANNCVTPVQSVIITEPALLAFTTALSNVLCFNGNSGSITVNATGGVTNFQYSKDGGGTYQSSNIFLGLSASTSQIVVKDANSCVTAAQSSIISEPILLSFTKTSSDVLCNNGNSGSITVNVSGGTGVMQYSKNNGSIYQSSNIFTGLTATSYQLVVKDFNNCVTSAQSEIINEPTLLSFTKTSTNVLCKNGNSGSITVNAIGGTGILQYSNDNGSTYQSSNVLSGLVANTYQIVVKDANNCVTAAQSVIITEPALLSFTMTSSNVLCKNGNSGTINVNASGGVGTIQYSKDGGITYQFSNIFNGLIANNYQIIINDSNNCFTTAQNSIISEPLDTLSVMLTITNPICTNSNGFAGITPNGGTSPYSYLWSTNNNDSTEIVSGLLAGTYSVTVTDTNGCVALDSATLVTQFTILSLIFSHINASCNNNDGNINLVPSGDTANTYSYLWSNGSTNQNLSGIGGGTYSVTVTDSNGCVISDSASIYNSIAPSSIPICMVTVDSSSTKNVIVWEKPIATTIDSFRIYREVASVYVLVGNTSYNAISEFTDNANGINPNTTSYKYKISVLDSCGNESPLSTDHQTIHVQLSLAFPQGVNLSWNDYTGFTFSQYRILRDDFGNNNWQAIDSVSYGITTYTSTDVLPNARYIVEANRPTPCVSTRQSGNTRNSSKSNSASQTTGINELSDELSVQISPNPSNGKFTIELGSLRYLNNKCEIKIYNVLGEQIYFSELKQQTSTEIDLSKVNDGIYFVNIYNGDKMYTKKIIKN